MNNKSKVFGTLIGLAVGAIILGLWIICGNNYSQSRNNMSSDAARCRSLDGEFDGMTGKCFVLGEEV